MNIIITGSLGNIGLPLTQALAAKGHRVTVISHDAGKAKAIAQLGAMPAIGSLQDVDFLISAFEGADAVFTMVPPNYAAKDVRGYIKATGEGYAHAIAQTGVRHVVNLSSIGAHIPEGPGPTGANYYIEAKLNAVKDTHVLHLRPGMFYTNFLGAIPLVRHQHIIGNNFDAEVNMVLSHPADIAAAAAEALDACAFTGRQVRYIAGDEKNGAEIAAALGKAIGKPELRWMGFPDEAMLQAMLQNGLTEEMARVYVIEIGVAIREGILFDDYRQHRQQAFGTVLLENFAQEFAAAYNKN
jgi:uncharacterized protein YbjT (DUF2867 family)